MKTEATEIVRTLKSAGHVAYFAGGGVRDQMLGQEPKDIDIATSARPEQVQSLFPRVTGLEGKCFGVVRVLIGEQAFEVATFRRDGLYVDGRRPESVVFSSAEEDAQRRDFTINGLFFDPLESKLIDFVGGQADLQARLIRAIGNPEDRFREDRLRLLRAVRFASNLRSADDRPFDIEGGTWKAIKKNAAEVASVSAERKRDELDKIWAGPRPEHGFDLLDTSGLLKTILPDLDKMHGVEQPPQFHPEGDVFQHVRLMLSKLHNAQLPLALGVLFHDVGKPHAATVDPSGRIRFNGHETVGARMTEKIMKELRYSNEMIETVVALVENHMAFKDVTRMRVSTLKRFLARDTFPLELELHRVDCQSSHGDISNYDFLKTQMETLTQDEIRPQRLISGNDLIAFGLTPGREIGDILAKVEEAQLEGTVLTREEAMALARKLAGRPD
jgi:putative nucleotidyltransferase with HDIG domain